MSHHHERKEKNCLNCNAEVAGRFCQVCGQENIEPKESFWVLATHFINDLTHFDGKFFSTLKYLLFKPGYLSQEYLRGKRTSYLHPIRMYLFTSFIFFLIFFKFYQPKDTTEEIKTPIAIEIAKLEKERIKLDSAIIKKDTAEEEMTLVEMKKKYLQLSKGLQILKKDSTKRDSVVSLNEHRGKGAIKDSSVAHLKTEKEYDSIQNSLPIAKRDNFINRNVFKKYLSLKLKYNNDQRKMFEAVSEKFFHLFPQMLFVSLPLFALILQLLYIRRKQVYYVNHVVFTIHLYCATFILILASLILGSLSHFIHLSQWTLPTIGSLIIFFYWYKAFRNFYGQSRKKTVFKYGLLFFTTFFLMILLFSVFALFSFFEL